MTPSGFRPNRPPGWSVASESRVEGWSLMISTEFWNFGWSAVPSLHAAYFAVSSRMA
jgi:hypothetical protein